MRLITGLFLTFLANPIFAQNTRDYVLAEVARSFDSPIFVTAAPDDSRLFVVQQNGVIAVLQAGETREVLDIRNRVTHAGEAGLLGMALHPDFLENGLAYISYTTGNLTSMIEEIHYDFANGRFDNQPVRVIYRLDQPARNHNGGMIAFGPDGYLFAGFGDGGGANDTYANGQNLDTALGTILRIDVDNPRNLVPRTNPQPNGPAPLAWAYGLRNPWRFSFDGDLLFIGDVGQSTAEEISVVSAGSSGLNLGWPDAEGATCLARPDCKSQGYVAPVLTYPTGDGCAITGGYVYRGAALPELRGTYFYGDFCNGRIFSFEYKNGKATAQRSWAADLGEVDLLASFGLDGFGELYVVSLAGIIYRLERR
ncbi:MAG: PQQ-dependent sugar dehydrogenase [Rhodobacteraceae bacterium]|nr:PQQ-dependent sugar dehydrogenase [Paracoccaceae bacterium]